MCLQELSLWRLRIVADSDPGAVARVLERFQSLNVLRRRIVAECTSNDSFHIEWMFSGLRSSNCGWSQQKFSNCRAL